MYTPRFLIGVVLVCLACTPALAQDDIHSREYKRLSLADLDGIAVTVTISSNAKSMVHQAGLRKEVVRREVIPLFRQSNIKVYRNYDSLGRSPRKDPLPIVNVGIRVTDVAKEEFEGSIFVYRIEVSVGQIMETTSGRRLYATSYSTQEALGTTGVEGLPRLIRFSKNRVREFITDWLVAHQ